MSLRQSNGAWRRSTGRALVALFTGGVCALFCALVERTAIPPSLEPLSEPVYRVLYFAGLIPRAILRMTVYDGEVGKHFNPAGPISFFLVPFMVWGVWWCFIRLRRIPLAFGRPEAVDRGRRAFFAQGAVAAVGVGAAGIGAHSSLIEPQRLRFVPYDVPIADLPRAFDGLRVAHISDTHYGPFITLDYLHHVIDRVNDARPDLVVLTGDYVHRTRNAIPDGIGVLERLQAPMGVVGVLGNHDHWEGAEGCRKRFAEIGIPLIDNGFRFLTAKGLGDAPAAEAICIGGVGDYWEDAVRPREALAAAPGDVPRLLLSHNPDVAETDLRTTRIDLMLSGHTHGGQVRLPFWGSIIIPSHFGDKYAGGLVDGPHCRVLISRGVGMAGVPVRVGVPPEVPIVTLRA